MGNEKKGLPLESQSKRVGNEKKGLSLESQSKRVESKKTKAQKVKSSAEKKMANKSATKKSIGIQKSASTKKSKSSVDVFLESTDIKGVSDMEKSVAESSKLSSKKTKKISSKSTQKKARASEPKSSKAKEEIQKGTEEIIPLPSDLEESSQEILEEKKEAAISELTRDFNKKKIVVSEVLLTDAEGRVLCKSSGCDDHAVVESYCRYHYLFHWKKIQLKKKILSEGKLNKYINELTSKYPSKYLEMLRNDLKSEKDFLLAIQELEIEDSDTSTEGDEDSFIEAEVQGVTGNKRSRNDDY